MQTQENTQEIISELLKAKQANKWRPVMFLRWHDGRYCILREPLAREADSYVAIREKFGPLADREIITACWLAGSETLLTEKAIGYISGAVEKLLQWSLADVQGINSLIDASRQTSSRMIDHIDTYIRGLNPGMVPEQSDMMTYSEALRHLHSTERVLSKIDPAQKTFRMVTPDMLRLEKEEAQRSEIEKIIAQAPPEEAERIIPTPNEVAQLERERAQARLKKRPVKRDFR